MAQTRDVVANLPATQAIMDFLLHPNNQAKIDIILAEVRQHYIQGWRQGRLFEIDTAIKKLRETTVLMERFEIVIGLLNAKSGFEYNSLNTILLDKLLEATGYTLISKDDRFQNGKQELRKVLQTQVVDKGDKIAKETKEAKLKEEKEHKDVAEHPPIESVPLQPEDKEAIRNMLNKFLRGEIEKQKTNPVAEKPRQKMDAKELAKKHALLKPVVAQLQEKIKQKAKLAHDPEEQIIKLESIPTQEIKRERKKLKDNPSYTQSLAAIGGFFAAKYPARSKVQDKFAEEFAAIKKHFGAK